MSAEKIKAGQGAAVSETLVEQRNNMFILLGEQLSIPTASAQPIWLKLLIKISRTRLTREHGIEQASWLYISSPETLSYFSSYEACPSQDHVLDADLTVPLPRTCLEP